MITSFLRCAWLAGAIAFVPILASCAGGGSGVPTGRAPTSGQFDFRSGQAPRSGKFVFRFDTFGDEQFWTKTLGLNTVIQKSVSPVTALSVGLKVDVDALPMGLREGILKGRIDLNSPATTVALLKLNAVVGVVGKVDGHNNLTSVGITCAICHSTVDNSFAKGIGHRLDGYPNRDLNPGAIIALSPAITAQQRSVYTSWGPGRYDPRFNEDGINGPVPIPPAYGLAGVNLATYTGDGSIEYWNDYVAVTQMHGLGNFSDPRIGVTATSPIELVKPVLPVLRDYEVSLLKPSPPPVTDPASVTRGQSLFQAHCSSCHSGATFTDANERLHEPSETCTNPQYAQRSATKMYRTTPLRGLASHPPYFHDGSAATLADVVAHYNTCFNLALTAKQQADLTAYLNTL